MNHLLCLKNLNAWLTERLRPRTRRRKVDRLSAVGPECLEQRQLLVADPTGTWMLTTDAHTGEGTAMVTQGDKGLHFSGTFPEYSMNFDIDARQKGGDPDQFKGKGRVTVFDARAKVKFQLEFTSETTLVGTAKTKFKGSPRVTQMIEGTKVLT